MRSNLQFICVDKPSSLRWQHQQQLHRFSVQFFTIAAHKYSTDNVQLIFCYHKVFMLNYAPNYFHVGYYGVGVSARVVLAKFFSNFHWFSVDMAWLYYQINFNSMVSVVCVCERLRVCTLSANVISTANTFVPMARWQNFVTRNRELTFKVAVENVCYN